MSDAGTPAVPGLYHVTASAVADGKRYAVDTAVTARVDSVTLGGAQGLSLNLAGLGSVALSDVKQIS
jgi:flagellar basal-body rod modification protein FlgD